MAKYFIALEIRGLLELRKDIEIRLVNSNRRAGSRAILKQHEPAHPWFWGWSKFPLTVSGQKVS